MADVIFVGNPNLFVVNKLKAGNSFLNNDTVTVTLRDITGTEVAGETWPVTMQYIAGSEGRYERVFPKDLVVSKGMLLTAFVDGGTVDPNTVHFECPILVWTRDCL